MKRPIVLSALVLLALLAGCKKPVPQVVRTQVPTATPVPDKDVLGFARGGGLWLMRYDGSEQRLLAQPGKGQALWFPVPSPAGDHLIAWLSRADGTQDVVRVELSGRLTVLTEIGSRAKPMMKSLRLGNAPAYSADGKRIAYSFNGDLWLMDASGYNAETFIADGNSWAPSFSPDGKRLAYVNGTDGRYDVWMADLESRDTWQVTEFSDFSVGQPRWNKDGTALLLTRSQGEDSDLFQLRLTKDASVAKGGLELSAPLTDADPLTKDRLSGSGVWDPGGWHVLFCSARDNGTTWNLYVADSTGGSPKQLTKEGAYSPFWMHPSGQIASVLDSAPSRPTPIVAKATAPMAIPTAVPPSAGSGQALAPLKPNAPSVPAASPPAAAPANAPAKPAAPAVAAKPAVPAAAPAAPAGAKPAPAQHAVASAPAPAPAAATAPAHTASAAPTQPPAKAAPLRLRLKASFADGALAPAGLADLKKLAPRVAQYAGETVTVIGPLDRSPLKGKFASEDARSLARAKAIVAGLNKEASLKPGVAKAQSYAAPAAGASGPPNSIQIYVEMK